MSPIFRGRNDNMGWDQFSDYEIDGAETDDTPFSSARNDMAQIYRARSDNVDLSEYLPQLYAQELDAAEADNAQHETIRTLASSPSYDHILPSAAPAASAAPANSQ
jgi:hypothetical protein